MLLNRIHIQTKYKKELHMKLVLVFSFPALNEWKIETKNLAERWSIWVYITMFSSVDGRGTMVRAWRFADVAANVSPFSYWDIVSLGKAITP